MFVGFLISCAVLGLSLAVALYLRDKKILTSDFAGQCVVFGPTAVFWIIGVGSGKSVISTISCFAGYKELPSGLYADATGNVVAKGDIIFDCGASIVGSVFFEGFAGAWFSTIPEGVKVAFQAVSG